MDWFYNLLLTSAALIALAAGLNVPKPSEYMPTLAEYCQDAIPELESDEAYAQCDNFYHVDQE